MRWAIASVAALHGLIHGLGAAKAFGMHVPLTMPVSKTAGMAWVTAGLLWIAAAGMVALGSRSWWMAAVPALILSQVLICMAWADARYGTILNLLLLVPVAIAAAAASRWGVAYRYDRAVAGAMAQAAPFDPRPVTEEDAAHLPAAVRRYLRYTNTIGQPRVGNYRITFSGVLRDRPDATWMPSRVRQFSLVHPAGRWFTVSAASRGVPFDALHIYEGKHATFEVRVATLMKVVDARGPEMDLSETVTLFNDMCLLAPATLIDPAISWTEQTPAEARAVFTNAGHTISATLQVDAEGALRNFISDDRYRSIDGKTFERLRWSTPVTRYAMFGPRRVATDAEARWHLPSGAFTYARFTVIGAEYNVTSD